MNRHFYQKTQLILLQLKPSAKNLINFLVICFHIGHLLFYFKAKQFQKIFTWSLKVTKKPSMPL